MNLSSSAATITKRSSLRLTSCLSKRAIRCKFQNECAVLLEEVQDGGKKGAAEVACTRLSAYRGVGFLSATTDAVKRRLACAPSQELRLDVHTPPHKRAQRQSRKKGRARVWRERARRVSPNVLRECLPACREDVRERVAGPTRRTPPRSNCAACHLEPGLIIRTFRRRRAIGSPSDNYRPECVYAQQHSA